MKQYKELLEDIKKNGEWKDPAREGMPRTKSIFSRSKRFDLTQGFPALTLKKLFWKGVVGELIWFLRGNTNIKYLVDNNIHIWDDDAYKYWNTEYNDKAEFLEELGDQVGDCGHIYGYQWRNWNGNFDQIKHLIENIRNNSNSRYNRVTAWNPTDFLHHPDNAALPACHTDFQVYIRQGKYLDLDMTQRSCDTFLGVPLNIASYALLTHILANLTGYLAGELIWNGKDIHYYENHEDQVNEVLKREPLSSPRLTMRDTYWYRLDLYKENKITLDCFINGLEIDEFILDDYNPHPTIKAPLSVGLK